MHPHHNSGRSGPPQPRQPPPAADFPLSNLPATGGVPLNPLGQDAGGLPRARKASLSGAPHHVNGFQTGAGGAGSSTFPSVFDVSAPAVGLSTASGFPSLLSSPAEETTAGLAALARAADISPRLSSMPRHSHSHSHSHVPTSHMNGVTGSSKNAPPARSLSNGVHSTGGSGVGETTWSFRRRGGSGVSQATAARAAAAASAPGVFSLTSPEVAPSPSHPPLPMEIELIASGSGGADAMPPLSLSTTSMSVSTPAEIAAQATPPPVPLMHEPVSVLTPPAGGVGARSGALPGVGPLSPPSSGSRLSDIEISPFVVNPGAMPATASVAAAVSNAPSRSPENNKKQQLEAFDFFSGPSAPASQGSAVNDIPSPAMQGQSRSSPALPPLPPPMQSHRFSSTSSSLPHTFAAHSSALSSANRGAGVPSNTRSLPRPLHSRSSSPLASYRQMSQAQQRPPSHAHMNGVMQPARRAQGETSHSHSRSTTPVQSTMNNVHDYSLPQRLSNLAIQKDARQSVPLSQSISVFPALPVSSSSPRSVQPSQSLFTGALPPLPPPVASTPISAGMVPTATLGTLRNPVNVASRSRSSSETPSAANGTPTPIVDLTPPLLVKFPSAASDASAATTPIPNSAPTPPIPAPPAHVAQPSPPPSAFQPSQPSQSSQSPPSSTGVDNVEVNDTASAATRSSSASRSPSPAPRPPSPPKLRPRTYRHSLVAQIDHVHEPSSDEDDDEDDDDTSSGVTGGRSSSPASAFMSASTARTSSSSTAAFGYTALTLPPMGDAVAGSTSTSSRSSSVSIQPKTLVFPNTSTASPLAKGVSGPKALDVGLLSQILKQPQGSVSNENLAAPTDNPTPESTSGIAAASSRKSQKSKGITRNGPKGSRLAKAAQKASSSSSQSQEATITTSGDLTVRLSPPSKSPTPSALMPPPSSSQLQPLPSSSASSTSSAATAAAAAAATAAATAAFVRRIPDPSLLIEGDDTKPTDPDYKHPPEYKRHKFKMSEQNYFLTRRNVYHPACKALTDKRNRMVPDPCNCSLTDENQTTACDGDQCLNVGCKFECPKNCRLSKICKNRFLGKRGKSKLKVMKCGGKGFGLIAQKPISAKEFIIEYTGEIIPEKEVDRRLRTRYYHDKKYYMLRMAKEFQIDATRYGSKARFINHSCDPNAETQFWTGADGLMHACLFAINDIHIGTEVTFNYKFQRYGPMKTKCLCGSSNCSGYLGDPPKKIRPPAPRRPLSGAGGRSSSRSVSRMRDDGGEDGDSTSTSARRTAARRKAAKGKLDERAPDRPEFDKKARAAEIDHMFALLLAPEGPGTPAAVAATVGRVGAAAAKPKTKKQKKAAASASKGDKAADAAGKPVRVFDGFYKCGRGLLQEKTLTELSHASSATEQLMAKYRRQKKLQAQKKRQAPARSAPSSSPYADAPIHSHAAFTAKALELTSAAAVARESGGKGGASGGMGGVGGHARLFDGYVRQRAHKNSFDRIQRHMMRQQRLAEQQIAAQLKKAASKKAKAKPKAADDIPAAATASVSTPATTSKSTPGAPGESASAAVAASSSPSSSSTEAKSKTTAATDEDGDATMVGDGASKSHSAASPVKAAPAVDTATAHVSQDPVPTASASAPAPSTALKDTDSTSGGSPPAQSLALPVNKQESSDPSMIDSSVGPLHSPQKSEVPGSLSTSASDSATDSAQRDRSASSSSSSVAAADSAPEQPPVVVVNRPPTIRLPSPVGLKRPGVKGKKARGAKAKGRNVSSRPARSRGKTVTTPTNRGAGVGVGATAMSDAAASQSDANTPGASSSSSAKPPPKKPPPKKPPTRKRRTSVPGIDGALSLLQRRSMRIAHLEPEDVGPLAASVWSSRPKTPPSASPTQGPAPWGKQKSDADTTEKGAAISSEPDKASPAKVDEANKSADVEKSVNDGDAMTAAAADQEIDTQTIDPIAVSAREKLAGDSVDNSLLEEEPKGIPADISQPAVGVDAAQTQRKREETGGDDSEDDLSLPAMAKKYTAQKSLIRTRSSREPTTVAAAGGGAPKKAKVRSPTVETPKQGASSPTDSTRDEPTPDKHQSDAHPPARRLSARSPAPPSRIHTRRSRKQDVVSVGEDARATSDEISASVENEGSAAAEMGGADVKMVDADTATQNDGTKEGGAELKQEAPAASASVAAAAASAASARRSSRISAAALEAEKAAELARKRASALVSKPIVRKPKPKPLPLVQQIKFDPIPEGHPHAEDLKKFPGMKFYDDMVLCVVCQRFASKSTSWEDKRPYDVAIVRAHTHWDSQVHENSLKELLKHQRRAVNHVAEESSDEFSSEDEDEEVSEEGVRQPLGDEQHPPVEERSSAVPSQELRSEADGGAVEGGAEPASVPPPVRIHRTRSRSASLTVTPLVSPTAAQTAGTATAADVDSEASSRRRHNLRSRVAASAQEENVASGKSPAPRRSRRIRQDDRHQRSTTPAAATEAKRPGRDDEGESNEAELDENELEKAMKDIDKAKSRFADFHFENTEYWCDLCATTYAAIKAARLATSSAASTPKRDRSGSSASQTPTASLPCSPLTSPVGKFSRLANADGGSAVVASSPKTPAASLAEVHRGLASCKWVKHRTWRIKKGSSFAKEHEKHQARNVHVRSMHALLAQSEAAANDPLLIPLFKKYKTLRMTTKGEFWCLDCNAVVEYGTLLKDVLRTGDEKPWSQPRRLSSPFAQMAKHLKQAHDIIVSPADLVAAKAKSPAVRTPVASPSPSLRPASRSGTPRTDEQKQQDKAREARLARRFRKAIGAVGAPSAETTSGADGDGDAETEGAASASDGGSRESDQTDATAASANLPAPIKIPSPTPATPSAKRSLAATLEAKVDEDVDDDGDEAKPSTAEDEEKQEVGEDEESDDSDESSSDTDSESDSDSDSDSESDSDSSDSSDADAVGEEAKSPSEEKSKEKGSAAVVAKPKVVAAPEGKDTASESAVSSGGSEGEEDSNLMSMNNMMQRRAQMYRLEQERQKKASLTREMTMNKKKIEMKLQERMFGKCQPCKLIYSSVGMKTAHLKSQGHITCERAFKEAERLSRQKDLKEAQRLQKGRSGQAAASASSSASAPDTGAGSKKRKALDDRGAGSGHADRDGKRRRGVEDTSRLSRREQDDRRRRRRIGSPRRSPDRDFRKHMPSSREPSVSSIIASSGRYRNRSPRRRSPLGRRSDSRGRDGSRDRNSSSSRQHRSSFDDRGRRSRDARGSRDLRDRDFRGRHRPLPPSHRDRSRDRSVSTTGSATGRSSHRPSPSPSPSVQRGSVGPHSSRSASRARPPVPRFDRQAVPSARPTSLVQHQRGSRANESAPNFMTPEYRQFLATNPPTNPQNPTPQPFVINHQQQPPRQPYASALPPLPMMPMINHACFAQSDAVGAIQQHQPHSQQFLQQQYHQQQQQQQQQMSAMPQSQQLRAFQQQSQQPLAFQQQPPQQQQFQQQPPLSQQPPLQNMYHQPQQQLPQQASLRTVADASGAQIAQLQPFQQTRHADSSVAVNNAAAAAASSQPSVVAVAGAQGAKPDEKCVVDGASTSAQKVNKEIVSPPSVVATDARPPRGSSSTKRLTMARRDALVETLVFANLACFPRFGTEHATQASPSSSAASSANRRPVSKPLVSKSAANQTRASKSANERAKLPARKSSPLLNLSSKSSPRLPKKVQAATQEGSPPVSGATKNLSPKVAPSTSSPKGSPSALPKRKSHSIHPSRLLLQRSPSKSPGGSGGEERKTSTSSNDRDRHDGKSARDSRKRSRSAESSPARSARRSAKKPRNFASGSNTVPVTSHGQKNSDSRASARHGALNKQTMRTSDGPVPPVGARLASPSLSSSHRKSPRRTENRDSSREAPTSSHSRSPMPRPGTRRRTDDPRPQQQRRSASPQQRRENETDARRAGHSGSELRESSNRGRSDDFDTDSRRRHDPHPRNRDDGGGNRSAETKEFDRPRRQSREKHRSPTPRRSERRRSISPRLPEHPPPRARSAERQGRLEERHNAYHPSMERRSQLSPERRRRDLEERHRHLSPDRPHHSTHSSREPRRLSPERRLRQSPYDPNHRRSLEPDRRRLPPPDSRRHRHPSLDHRHAGLPIPPRRSRSLSPRGRPPLPIGHNIGPRRSRSLSPPPPPPRRSRSLSLRREIRRSSEERFVRDRRDPLERDRSRERHLSFPRSEQRREFLPDERRRADERPPRDRHVDQLRRHEDEARHSRSPHHAPSAAAGSLRHTDDDGSFGRANAADHLVVPTPQVFSPRTQTSSLDPAANVWVGNLPVALKPVELEHIFQNYGEVIFAQMTGVLNGSVASGMVQFRRAEDARSAAQALDGCSSILPGMLLSVRTCAPQPPLNPPPLPPPVLTPAAATHPSPRMMQPPSDSRHLPATAPATAAAHFARPRERHSAAARPQQQQQPPRPQQGQGWTSVAQAPKPNMPTKPKMSFMLGGSKTPPPRFTNKGTKRKSASDDKKEQSASVVQPEKRLKTVDVKPSGTTDNSTATPAKVPKPLHVKSPSSASTSTPNAAKSSVKTPSRGGVPNSNSEPKAKPEAAASPNGPSGQAASSAASKRTPSAPGNFERPAAAAAVAKSSDTLKVPATAGDTKRSRVRSKSPAAASAPRNKKRRYSISRSSQRSVSPASGTKPSNGVPKKSDDKAEAKEKAQNPVEKKEIGGAATEKRGAKSDASPTKKRSRSRSSSKTPQRSNSRSHPNASTSKPRNGSRSPLPPPKKRQRRSHSRSKSPRRDRSERPQSRRPSSRSPPPAANRSRRSPPPIANRNRRSPPPPVRRRAGRNRASGGRDRDRSRYGGGGGRYPPSPLPARRHPPPSARRGRSPARGRSEYDRERRRSRSRTPLETGRGHYSSGYTADDYERENSKRRHDSVRRSRSPPPRDTSDRRHSGEKDRRRDRSRRFSRSPSPAAAAGNSREAADGESGREK